MRKQLAVSVVLIVIGSSAAPAANDFPYDRTLSFTILRNGQEVGNHTLSFQNEGSNRTVTVAINLAVKSLGVISYRYSHSSTEMWSGNALRWLEARTDDNGRVFTVRTQKSNSKGMAVERVTPPETSPAATADQGLQTPAIAREVLSANILPTSTGTWRRLNNPVLLNTQYGTRSHVRISTIGRTSIKTASGTIEATRYRYAGDLQMDQWFDDRGRWVKAAFKAFDGSMIEYNMQD